MTKEMNNKLYDITEISDMFDNNFSKEELINFFEHGKIKGKKIEDKWFADNTAIQGFMQFLANERTKMLDTQTIDLQTISLKGRILDIGGGGEGVIEQLKGDKVVVIDLKKNELESGLRAGDTKSLKIVMDAKDLKFLDNSFDTVTAFFSMMYMKNESLERVFKEIYRVLDNEGELVIWDLVIPNRKNVEKDYIGIYLNVEIGVKIIESGYGTQWDKEQDVNDFVTLATSAGFTITEQKVDGNYFFIKCRKD